MPDAFLMKGKVWGDHKHKLSYPLVLEVKYDEIRLHVRLFPEQGAPGLANHIAEHVEFLSYSGKPLCNLWHWADRFKALMVEQGLTDLDLGVLVNGNFDDSYRWTRSSTGIPKEKLDKKTGKIAPALDVSMVQFYLFDLPGYGTVPFFKRRNMIDRVATLMDVNYRIPTRRPMAWEALSEAEVDYIFFRVRTMGYEGLMAKAWTHLYEPGKRIDGWLKMKPENEADARITGVNRAFSIHGEPLDRAGSVDVVMEDGSTASPSGIPHELGALMWANPDQYIGQWCTVEYMERDRKGGYRHPSFTRLREAK